MKLVKYKSGRKYMIRPLYREDIYMFQHCSGGRESIPSREYHAIIDMLMAHGRVCVSCETVDKPKYKRFNDEE